MAASGPAHGNMDIQDQRATFSGFIAASLWTSIHIAQLVALLTLAFAIGLGWWPGLFALIGIGVAAGLAFRMSGVYWAIQVTQWVLLGLGGLILPALSGLAG